MLFDLNFDIRLKTIKITHSNIFICHGDTNGDTELLEHNIIYCIRMLQSGFFIFRFCIY